MSFRLVTVPMLLLTIFTGGVAATPVRSAAALVVAARKAAQKKTTYDPRYIGLDYPMGDPGPEIGVCTDIVIRAYRAVGVDLQQLVHEDMASDFDAYPAKRAYNQKRPDPNIDHRRVTNLVTFLTRHGKKLTRSINPKSRDAWLPGDIVIFDLKGNGGHSHIGIISNRRDKKTGLPLVFHHLPPYPAEDNVLGEIPISGHFRY